MILQLRGVHPVLGVVGGVLVEVGHEDSLTVGGLDVLSGAAIAVATGADFLIAGVLAFNYLAFFFFAFCKGAAGACETYKVE